MFETVGFGAPVEFGEHIFKVKIDVNKNYPVNIIEDYGYLGGQGGLPYQQIRAIIPLNIWKIISKYIKDDFNKRLKFEKLKQGRWEVGTTQVERRLGMEVCLCAWATERAKPEELDLACRRWSALRPEERWWLYNQVSITAGKPEDFDKGWRKALYFVFVDGSTDISIPSASVVRSYPHLNISQEISNNLPDVMMLVITQLEGKRWWEDK